MMQDTVNKRFCARLRTIHREILIEFKDKMDREWSTSHKGVSVKYTPSTINSQVFSGSRSASLRSHRSDKNGES
jgi:hypothetical protein